VTDRAERADSIIDDDIVGLLQSLPRFIFIKGSRGSTLEGRESGPVWGSVAIRAGLPRVEKKAQKKKSQGSLITFYSGPRSLEKGVILSSVQRWSQISLPK